MTDDTPYRCPFCKADLTGEEYAHESLFGETRHYSRVIGREDPAVYDGVIAWHCPDCKQEWPR